MFTTVALCRETKPNLKQNLKFSIKCSVLLHLFINVTNLSDNMFSITFKIFPVQFCIILQIVFQSAASMVKSILSFSHHMILKAGFSLVGAAASHVTDLLEK